MDARAIDGTYVRVRPALPADREALYALHDAASLPSRTQRFFSEGSAAGHRFVDLLLAPERADCVALVAEHRGDLVALGTYVPVGGQEADVAFLVADDHQGMGLGTLLLAQLATVARSRGIVRFRADVLSTNRAVLAVFADSGFAERTTHDGPITAITLATELDATALTRSGDRERRAEDHSLHPLLNPRQVAVIGCGRERGAGHDVLRNLIDDGFTGQIFPVNPRAGVICALPAVASISAIDEPPATLGC